MDGNPWTTKDMDASANNKVTTYHLLGFAGSYTTAIGGDALDLSAIAAQIPTGFLPDQICEVMNGPASSFSGGGGYLQIVKSLVSNALHKLQVFSAGGSEQGSGTYASIKLTTDFITLVITWKKFA